jgi:hypothetical protein
MRVIPLAHLRGGGESDADEEEEAMIGFLCCVLLWARVWGYVGVWVCLYLRVGPGGVHSW